MDPFVGIGCFLHVACRLIVCKEKGIGRVVFEFHSGLKAGDHECNGVPIFVPLVASGNRHDCTRASAIVAYGSHMVRAMKLLMAFLIASMVAQPASAAPMQWQDAVCAAEDLRSCALAQSIHWLSRQKLVMQMAQNSGLAFSATGFLALVARAVAGPKPGIEFVIAASRVGMVWTSSVVITSLAVTTAATAGSVLLAAVRPAGGVAHVDGVAVHDDFLSHCAEAVEQIKTPDGLIQFLQLPQETQDLLLPCVNQDRELAEFLVQGAANGAELERGLKLN